MKLSFDKPLLMGILNLTPDSFFDGGKSVQTIHELSLQKIQKLIADGADIIDVGAESTFGPEAQVTAEEEWGRLEPALSLRVRCGGRSNLIPPDVDCRGRPELRDSLAMTTISIDTWKASVAERALKMGVHMINDVTALRGDPVMIEVLLKYKPYVCLMYSAYDTPYAGRENKQYDDVMATITSFLKAQADLLINRGFPREKIIIDPGLGFFLSTDPKYSWEVIERLEELKPLGFPILVGPSMKSFLGGEIKDRLSRTLEASQKCLENGANILRVHHVKEHRNLYNRFAT